MMRRQRERSDELADSVPFYSPYFGVSREETQANHTAMLHASPIDRATR
jgi:hypothetical protein